MRSTRTGEALDTIYWIEGSYIGPFSSVDHDCTVIGSELDHSIVLAGSRIEGVPRIVDSLIGRDAVVTRTQQRPKATRLMIGDHSQVDLDV